MEQHKENLNQGYDHVQPLISEQGLWQDPSAIGKALAKANEFFVDRPGGDLLSPRQIADQVHKYTEVFAVNTPLGVEVVAAGPKQMRTRRSANKDQVSVKGALMFDLAREKALVRGVDKLHRAGVISDDVARQSAGGEVGMVLADISDRMTEVMNSRLNKQIKIDGDGQTRLIGAAGELSNPMMVMSSVAAASERTSPKKDVHGRKYKAMKVLRRTGYGVTVTSVLLSACQSAPQIAVEQPKQEEPKMLSVGSGITEEQALEAFKTYKDVAEERGFFLSDPEMATRKSDGSLFMFSLMEDGEVDTSVQYAVGVASLAQTGAAIPTSMMVLFRLDADGEVKAFGSELSGKSDKDFAPDGWGLFSLTDINEQGEAYRNGDTLYLDFGGRQMLLVTEGEELALVSLPAPGEQMPAPTQEAPTPAPNEFFEAIIEAIGRAIEPRDVVQAGGSEGEVAEGEVEEDMPVVEEVPVELSAEESAAQELAAKVSEVESLGFAPDESFGGLYTKTEDGTVFLYDFERGEEMRVVGSPDLIFSNRSFTLFYNDLKSMLEAAVGAETISQEAMDSELDVFGKEPFSVSDVPLIITTSLTDAQMEQEFGATRFRENENFWSEAGSAFQTPFIDRVIQWLWQIEDRKDNGELDESVRQGSVTKSYIRSMFAGNSVDVVLKNGDIFDIGQGVRLNIISSQEAESGEGFNHNTPMGADYYWKREVDKDNNQLVVTIAVKNMHLWRSAFSDEEAFSRVWHQALLLPVWDAFFEARGGGEHENMLGAFVVPDGQETVGTTEATTAAWLDWYYGFESKVTNLSGGVIVGE